MCIELSSTLRVSVNTSTKLYRKRKAARTLHFKASVVDVHICRAGIVERDLGTITCIIYLCMCPVLCMSCKPLRGVTRSVAL